MRLARGPALWRGRSDDAAARHVALSLAAYADDPLLHLAMGDAFWRTDAGRPAQILVDRATSVAEGDAAAPLRVGYLSSDLREHAVGFLTAALYGCHDRTKVTVFAYYTGHAVTDETQARIRAGVDHWRDVAALSDAEAARLIADDRIQILVDLNGYTQGARQKVLAQRPAPVIVNWLGYPGSTGSPYHDVIIADPVIIPPEAERYYSETVRRLTCYQPNDPHRVVAAPPTRTEMGLPADAMVFCSFNGAQKLTPFTWARWMRILAGVPDGVLWLLDPGEECLARLRARAEDAGVDGARIIAAPRLANPSHLARYPLADLFLDSAPYGAHTTASDALWMGLPVLTLIGRGFAARVCASLVTAAGLPDLVCGDPETYVAQAIALGRDRARLSALRQRLVAGRDACALFDIKGLVRDLEALYAGIWDDHRAGRLARPDLTNLDLYREIGIALDADDVEAGQRPDLDALYRAALAERHRFEVVPADQRLWPGPAQAGAMSGAPARPRTRAARR